MAIAKNLAFHDTWGLSPGEFSSASSSILYPLLLALLYKLFGVHLVITFLVNLGAAMVCILVTQRWLQRLGLKPWHQLLILAAFILLTPIPVLVITGTEHILQVLFASLFLFRFTTWMAEETAQNARAESMPLDIYVWGLLLTATRYEGLFIILIACLVLMIKRKWLSCILFSLVSMAPIVIFGIYSLQKDAYFFPTSIMIKAIPIPPDGAAFQRFLQDDLFLRLFYPFATQGSIATGRILLILPLAYWLLREPILHQPQRRYMLFICLGTAILHLLFANVALFYRYEAYLIALTVLVVGILLAENPTNIWPAKGMGARWLFVWTGLFLFYPLFSRGWGAYKDARLLCLNTYEQGWQAAGFTNRFYNNATVVVDDIGANAYLGNGKKMDPATGIAYTEIARSKEGAYDRVEYMDYLIKKEQPALAIISESRYTYNLLQHWTKVADWYTNHRVLLRGDHISFYALNTDSVPKLKQQLKVYESLLPATVKVIYP
ncbi:MAG: hypothetical protein J0H74_22370 [Chitinophagaceae bacterium]|nr:hypothetical protein [Chitinophagaceae bacterium]